MSLHPCFRRMWFIQVCLGKPSHGSIPLLTSVFFCGWASNSQDSPKASPRVTFKWKNLISRTWLRKAFLQKHAFVDISVFPSLGKQQPRFAHARAQMKKLDIKNFVEPLKLLSQWMTGGESWMTPCTNICHYVPACANIAVCQLCRERQPLVEQSWWAWTENAWINATVFVPMAQAPPKAGAKMVVQSKFDPWVYILVFAECDLCRFVWESLPTEAYLCWHQCFSVVGQATAKIRPRPAHGLLSNEKTWYQELYRTTEAIVPMNDRGRKLNDTMHQYVPLRASMCQPLQFVSCAEKDSLWWNSHDGPELKMLGSMPWCSFPWHKLLPRLVQKNCCINLIDEFTSWVSPKATIAGLLRKAFLQKHAFVDISVFPSLGKQQPRFAHGQPTGYFQLKKLDIKNFIEPLKLLSQWMTGGESCMPTCTNMRPYVPACANIAVCQLCRERQPWNSHDGHEMPWCSFPWQKLLPRLAQNCCTI